MLSLQETGVSIRAGEPMLITVSPPGETRWGFYQFPDMWRAPGGEIYLAVNVGFDCEVDRHDPSLFFVSRDEGGSWRQTTLEEVDQAPPIITFSDGSQASFGATTHISHVHTYGHRQPWQFWYPQELGIAPLPRLFWDAYENHEFAVFRHADIPAEVRPIPAAWRPSPDTPWEHGACTLDVPDLLITCLARAWWWDKQHNRYAEDLLTRIFRPWPRNIVVLPDDTLVYPQVSVNPQSFAVDRLFYCVNLFASTDRGRTWQRRGMVADDITRTTDGYAGGEELAMQLLPNGDLYCVMRTEMGDQPDGSRYLAAARSSDGGYTWTPTEEIAPFSVTPFLLALANGTTAVVYGRPGVYVRAAGDSAHTWSEALPVLGPPEAELLQDRWWAVRFDSYSGNKISCGNLGVAVTGPDRFLLAYSDFRHRNADGEPCKAIFVREIIVEPCPR